MTTAAARTHEAAADNAGARGRPRSGGSARLAARPSGISFADSRGPALTIGRADDPAEREADSLAAQIFNGETPLVPRRSPPAIRRACAACAGEEEEDVVRRETVPGGDRIGGTAAPPSVAGLMARPGRALDPVARGFFERRFGRRFGDVAIHDGPAADTAARAIGARAFTAGSHIAFARGEYAPRTETGLRLLAHELVHVAQHDGAPPSVRRHVAAAAASTGDRSPAGGTDPQIAPLASHPDVPGTAADAVSGKSGRPLDAGTRGFMEQRFQRSFAAVRIHTGAEAAAAARSIGSAAYTIGSDIVFGSDVFQPRSGLGRRILAHELTHVVQQTEGGATPPGERHERDADAAAAAIDDGPVAVRERSSIGIAMLSMAELEHKLWARVPDTVKPYVRPIAEEAKAKLDVILPPSIEIPAPIVEAVQHPAATARAVAGEVKAAVIAKLPKSPTEAVQAAKTYARTKIRDTAMDAAGTAKGVVLEAANIVDTLLWLPVAEHQLVERLAGGSRVGGAVLAVNDRLVGYHKAGLEDARRRGLTDKETGAFAISQYVSSGIDSGVDKVDKAAFGDLPPEDALVFTTYELGELKGAIGSQVALALVGVEEVQLGLKAIGLVGAAKGIYDSVARNKDSWYKSPAFWGSILGVVLSLLGLRASKAGAKIIAIVVKTGSVLQAVPAIMQLYEHYNDPALAADPAKREKTLKADYGAIIKILSMVVMDAIRSGGAKPHGEPAPEGQAPQPQATPHAEEPAARPPPASPEAPRSVPAKPTGPDPHPPAPPRPAPAHAAAPEPEPAASARGVPDSPVVPRAKPAPATDPEPKTASPRGATEEPATPKSAASDEPAGTHADGKPKGANAPEAETLAKAPAEEGHHTEVRPDGIHLCSPPPCPLLRVIYAGELKRNKALRDQMDHVDEVRKTDPDRAARLSASLQGRLEAAQARTAMFADLPAHVTPEQRQQLRNLLADAADLNIALTPEQFRDLSQRFGATTDTSGMASTLSSLQRSLGRSRGVLREQLESGAPERITNPLHREPTDAIRNAPGTPHGGEKLPAIAGDWFAPRRGGAPGQRDYGIAPVPGQLAARLRTMHFNSFADFRQTFWQMVAQTPSLAREFAYHPDNLARMQRGQPPIVPGQALAGTKEWKPGVANIVYQIDHKLALQNAGGVYDLDNLQIVTKRVHDLIGE